MTLNNIKLKLNELVLDGLQTDGAHHKQYYLEKIYQLVNGKKSFKENKNDLWWESGIAP